MTDYPYIRALGKVLHLSTGACFGGVYLATGSLAASVAAHWLYNILVSARVERAPP